MASLLIGENQGRVNHLGFAVDDFEEAKTMYLRALKPLGYASRVEMTEHSVIGIGPANGRPDFWLWQTKPGQSRGSGLHLAFSANTQAEVKAFYDEALAAGFKDNGAPGPRPHYHPKYYAAFVFDKQGNNVEVVEALTSAGAAD